MNRVKKIVAFFLFLILAFLAIGYYNRINATFEKKILMHLYAKYNSFSINNVLYILPNKIKRSKVSRIYKNEQARVFRVEYNSKLFIVLIDEQVRLVYPFIDDQTAKEADTYFTGLSNSNFEGFNFVNLEAFNVLISSYDDCKKVDIMETYIRFNEGLSSILIVKDSLSINKILEQSSNSFRDKNESLLLDKDLLLKVLENEELEKDVMKLTYWTDKSGVNSCYFLFENCQITNVSCDFLGYTGNELVVY